MHTYTGNSGGSLKLGLKAGVGGGGGPAGTNCGQRVWGMDAVRTDHGNGRGGSRKEKSVTAKKWKMEFITN
uniref:Uncharacterized protein n=1 Tax=Anguilla anguilla TaxID=7936 RepID=A0A0E9UMV5_ANGAN